MNYRSAATQGTRFDELDKVHFPEDGLKPVPVKGEKSQGALNRSERATIVLAAKESWGKRLTAKDKQEIENLAEEIAIEAIKAEPEKDMYGGKYIPPDPKSKRAREFTLRKIVYNAGLGKLAKKNVLRNGQQRKLRASQLILAIEGANQNTEEK